MNTAVQVILLFTVYFLIFILGAFAGYVYGVKKRCTGLHELGG